MRVGKHGAQGSWARALPTGRRQLRVSGERAFAQACCLGLPHSLHLQTTTHMGMSVPWLASPSTRCCVSSAVRLAWWRRWTSGTSGSLRSDTRSGAAVATAAAASSASAISRIAARASGEEARQARKGFVRLGSGRRQSRRAQQHCYRLMWRMAAAEGAGGSAGE